MSVAGIGMQSIPLTFKPHPLPVPSKSPGASYSESATARTLQCVMCPACDGQIIWLLDRTTVKTGQHMRDVSTTLQLLWPQQTRCDVPTEVPTEIANDYAEAAKTLQFSAKASAALSRRCLQAVLHERYRIHDKNLSVEIDQFISQQSPPSHIKDLLHAIRWVGNFAAHPVKELSSGAITDVEPGEAELLLEVVMNLFDFAYVQPARSAKAKADLNAKLIAAGKPTIP